MTFETESLAKYAFKKILGASHTGNAKDYANEAVPSDLTISSQIVFVESIPSTPPGASDSKIIVCTTGQDGELELDLDGSSNGKAYFVEVPTGHELTNHTNPETGVNYIAGDRVRRTIPKSFGSSYRPLLKDNGAEVPPLDASDWFLDENAGIVVSETDLSLGATGTLACYVYVGKTIDDWLDQDVTIGAAPTFTANNLSDGGSNAIVTTTQETNWDTHLSSDGSDHTFIDQSVISGASPTLDGTNFTGIPDGALDSTFLKNIVEDTTPQLGGELDCQANTIGFTQQTATGDGTTTIDWTTGNKFKFTFGAQNETFTFSPAPTKPCNLILMMIQDATGGRTATWPATVKWPSGTAPTLSAGANDIDILSFYFDGTNYYGQSALDFS